MAGGGNEMIFQISFVPSPSAIWCFYDTWSADYQFSGVTSSTFNFAGAQRAHDKWDSWVSLSICLCRVWMTPTWKWQLTAQVPPQSFTSASFYTGYLLMLFWPSSLDINNTSLSLSLVHCSLAASLLSLFAFHLKFAGAIQSWRRGVCVHFQGWNKSCNKNPSVGSGSRWIQGDPSWDINFSSQTGSVIVLCQTGEDTLLFQHFF